MLYHIYTHNAHVLTPMLYINVIYTIALQTYIYAHTHIHRHTYNIYGSVIDSCVLGDGSQKVMSSSPGKVT